MCRASRRSCRRRWTLDLKCTPGDLMDAASDSQTVVRSEKQCAENQQVERSLYATRVCLDRLLLRNSYTRPNSDQYSESTESVDGSRRRRRTRSREMGSGLR